MEKLKFYTENEILDEHIGKKGTENRTKFEYELQMDIIANKIKEERKKRNLTQSELGELVGVKKAQISKLEKGLLDCRIDTIIKVFKALNTKIKIVFDTDNNEYILS